MKILVAEDNDVIRDGLEVLLESEGYVVRTAVDGVDALKIYHEQRPDLVLLDVMMPRLNGFAVCKEIRKIDGVTPIIFLTGADDEVSEVRGLSLLANDFISKNTSEQILLARIACAARAVPNFEKLEGEEADCGKIYLGEAVLDKAQSKVIQPKGWAVSVSSREMGMLLLFAQNPTRILKYESLVRTFWGADVLPATVIDALKTQISTLRKKLGASGRCLRCRRGIGYVYVPGD